MHVAFLGLVSDWGQHSSLRMAKVGSSLLGSKDKLDIAYLIRDCEFLQSSQNTSIERITTLTIGAIGIFDSGSLTIVSLP